MGACVGVPLGTSVGYHGSFWASNGSPYGRVWDRMRFGSDFKAVRVRRGSFSGEFRTWTVAFERHRQDARRSISRVLSSLAAGTAIPLGRASRRASRDQPGRRGGNAPAAHGGTLPVATVIRRPPLFGLAPGGVCPAAPVTGGAGRSCRPVSPLPAGSCLLARAVCSLWHFPWGRPRRPLTGTAFPWSPDFPPPGLRLRAIPAAAVQPSG